MIPGHGLRAASTQLDQQRAVATPDSCIVGGRHHRAAAGKSSRGASPAAGLPLWPATPVHESNAARAFGTIPSCSWRRHWVRSWMRLSAVVPQRHCQQSVRGGTLSLHFCAADADDQHHLPHRPPAAGRQRHCAGAQLLLLWQFVLYGRPASRATTGLRRQYSVGLSFCVTTSRPAGVPVGARHAGHHQLVGSLAVDD